MVIERKDGSTFVDPTQKTESKDSSNLNDKGPHEPHNAKIFEKASDYIPAEKPFVKLHPSLS